MAFSWGSFILGEEHPCSVEKIPSSTAPRPGCPSMADVLAELQLDPVLRTGVQVTLLLTNHRGGYFLVTWKQIPWKWQNHLAMLDSKLCLGSCDCFVVVCCYENRKLLWKCIDFLDRKMVFTWNGSCGQGRRDDVFIWSRGILPQILAVSPVFWVQARVTSPWCSQKKSLFTDGSVPLAEQTHIRCTHC